MKIIYVVKINIAEEPLGLTWEPKRAYTTRLAAAKHIEWCWQEYGHELEYCIEELELYE